MHVAICAEEVRHLRAVRPPWIAAAGMLGLATVLLWSGVGGDDVSTAIADVSGVAAGMAGTFVVLGTARRSPLNRTAWRLLGAAMALWSLGEILWSYYEVVAGDEVPFPSIADVAYLGAVPCAVAGMLAFARPHSGRFHLRAVLDACLVSGAVLFVGWALVLGPAWHMDTGTIWAHVISVSYPATDLVLVVLALAVVLWGGSTARASIVTLAAALLAMAVADIAFTWLTNQGSFSSSNPISMLWPLSYLLFAFATQLDTSAPAQPSEVESAWSVVLPYLPVVGVLTVAAPRIVRGEPLGPFLAATAYVVLVLLVVRQAVTALDLRVSVRALHARERELERLASEDPLTGLANRSSFMTQLERAVAVRGAEPAVIYIDLYGFKQINDRFGHAVGDDLLIEVATRLQSCTRAATLLARLGGDEFVVLVESGHDDAVRISRRILQAFVPPFQRPPEVIPFQASLGIATAPRGGTPEEAVRRADAAMYVAKDIGKNRVVDYPNEALVLTED